MIYNLLMTFDEWISKKYLAWRGDAIGNEGSVAKFADYIGVGESLMYQWMKSKTRGGKSPTSHNKINLLVAKYGDEVYEILGIEAQPKDRIIRLIDKFPEDAYTLLEKKIREAMVDYDMV